MKTSEAMKMVLFWICAGLYIFSFGAKHAAAQDLNPYSSGRMERTLLELKEETEEAVANNRKLAEKVERFKARVNALESELEQFKSVKEELLKTRDSAHDRLQEEMKKTQAVSEGVQALDKKVSFTDEHELFVQDQISRQNAEEEILRQKAQRLQKEVADLKKQVKALSVKKIHPAASPAYARWSGILKENQKRFHRARQTYEQKRDEGLRLEKETNPFLEKNRSLQARQASLEQEIAAIVGEQESLKEAYATRQEEGDERLAQLVTEVDGLKVKKAEILQLVDSMRRLNDTIKSGPPPKDLERTVEKLSRENSLLNAQQELLTRLAAQRAGTEGGSPSDAELKNAQDRIAQLDAQQRELSNSLEDKERAIKEAQVSIKSLEKSVREAKKDVEILTAKNQAALQRPPVKKPPVKKKVDLPDINQELSAIRDENRAKEERLAVLQQELAEISAQEPPSPTEDYNLETLKAEVDKLKLNKEYLAGTLKIAKTKLNDLEVQSLGPGEEEDLRNHIVNLEQENKHLQVQIFSLDVAREKKLERAEGDR